MFGGGRGPMGGGGGMLKFASRAVARAGVANNGNLQEPFSSSSSSSSPAAASNASHGSSRKTQKLNSSSSSSSSSLSGSNGLIISASGSTFNLPVAVNWGAGGGVAVYDDFDWVSIDGSDDEFVLGPVPSVDEVQDAVSALQQVFDPSTYSQLVKDKVECNFNKDAPDRTLSSPTGMFPRVCSVGSELDWIEPSVRLCDPRMLQPRGHEHVYDAFHLLRTEPCIQRMVISLSSDKAIWDAVMNNEVVREIQESYNAGLPEAKKDIESSDETPEESNPATNFIMWVFDNTKTKVLEVFEKITKVVAEFFKHGDDEKMKEGKSNPFEEKLRTSVLLSIVVLLVVVVTRTSRV